ncbi:MAG: methyltransferase domain-containing protein [Rhodovarius sp.]|nr:methyltransferase domain-containing protein [Rhodovarius sp.]
MSDTIGPYHRGFREFAEAYEAFGFADIHADAMPFLPAPPGLVLDVGAGSGRDAAWFAARGFEVIAVEPAANLRGEAARLHPSPAIRWFDDRLPSLAAVHRLGLAFDLVWLSGVWMHLPPEERRRAMRRLATLLKPGGRLVLTLRHGPAPPDRPMWPVDAPEVERLGLEFGLALRAVTERREDRAGRADVRWQTVVLDLPQDGSGALPLLRGVILRQEKVATYKLALLRAVARIADASANVAREAGEDVELPLGLVALNWIRLFKPLIERRLPQMPERVGMKPAFVTEAFAALAPLAPSDLRLGMRFAAETGEALRRALRDAAKTIVQMPARHLTYANDAPVFPAEYGRLPARAGAFAVTEEVLWEYGTMRVPLPVWQALTRMGAWIEPMLVAEWVRLTRSYAERAGRVVATDEVLSALRWSDPERDTRFVRDLAEARIAQGVAVRCVWSGRPVSHDTLDIDHCLPFSAWACNDLWNLLPAHRRLNQREKRERLVAAAALAAAKDAILAWWDEAYLHGDEATRVRFAEEVRTSLPVAKDRAPDLAEVFAGVEFRRLRLRQEAALPEWPGPVAAG